MQPSHKWFPTSLQERAAWYQNFSTQFLVVATQLGFTALDQSAVDADNLIVQFLAQTAVDIDFRRLSISTLIRTRCGSIA